MRSTLLVIFLFLGVDDRLHTTEDCIRSDVVFVLDWSSSVRAHTTYLTSSVRQFIFKTEAALATGNLRVGLVSFGSTGKSWCALTSNRHSLHHRLDDLEQYQLGSNTSVYRGLHAAQALFEEQPRAVSRIVILISDGESNLHSDAAQEIAYTLKTVGVRVIAIFIAREGFQNRAGRTVVDDPAMFMFQISSGEESFFWASFESLEEVVKQIDICY